MRTPRLPHPTALLLGLSMLASLSACQPDYGSIEVELGTTPPAAASIHSTDFQIQIGTAVLINVTPVSANRNDYIETDTVEMTSQDRAVMDVEPGPEGWSFVLIGAGVGETCVEVVINGAVEDCISARVVEQQ
ncbi:MAG: hypothetical protein R3A79_18270 [Nannocystaceae bacterium]